MTEQDWRRPPKVIVQVTSAPIDSSAAGDIAESSDGALVVFSGRVRDENEGRRVSGLEYEAYNRMAEEQMRDIAARAQKEHGAGSVLIIHRTGNLSVGEVSVVTAVSAPHRDAAFRACRFCIDAVKEKAAIWKKEIFVDGSTQWVNGA